MEKVHKYILLASNRTTVVLPLNSEILYVGSPNQVVNVPTNNYGNTVCPVISIGPLSGQIFMWVLVNDKIDLLEERVFETVLTDMRMMELQENEYRKYLGSSFVYGGTSVYHVFEIIKG